ncbi:hypothetical protein DDR33_16755 [Pararcticibacter amylolyticus]|uniref:Uncharacterized protein n=1 Tax=Pararcticibacter amylolyticus TaxID=2173175 RepID=A0A2U2PDE7_9SPHI|nr:hypothetical protein DDR33_16755 [Pararcticibacter amylolyticus]
MVKNIIFNKIQTSRQEVFFNHRFICSKPAFPFQFNYLRVDEDSELCYLRYNTVNTLGNFCFYQYLTTAFTKTDSYERTIK